MSVKTLNHLQGKVLHSRSHAFIITNLTVSLSLIPMQYLYVTALQKINRPRASSQC